MDVFVRLRRMSQRCYRIEFIIQNSVDTIQIKKLIFDVGGKIYRIKTTNFDKDAEQKLFRAA